MKKKKKISFNLSESESNELPNRAFSRNFTNSNGIIKKIITAGKNNSNNFKGLTLRKSNINSIPDHESIDYKVKIFIYSCSLIYFFLILHIYIYIYQLR